ncbi:MAG TPA: DNA polymerase III subunit chi [Parvularcula sp.]|nr:DNA polymerase III subunit chi [Parvularcula sp.]HBS32880.1 DNA polymerase III subunit chi [Parvularcula sp.]HBS33755.1 DNA polymerase III subunit chi [Parvularcula sp.]
MTEALFYHLERATLDSVLPGLLERTLERGWKAVVRCGSRAMAERLDELLWTFSEESFLPHAADHERADAQPVWLTDDDVVPNGADVLFLVDNATAEASSISRFARCVTIFDGRDEAALRGARDFWTAVKAAGHDATYWKQSPQGRWEKQA